MAEVAGRLRERVKRSHRTLERELLKVLDESASPSCCFKETVERVKSFAAPASPEPDSRDRESDPR